MSTTGTGTEVSAELLEEGRRAYALDREHVFHSWVAQGGFEPMVITRSEDRTGPGSGRCWQTRTGLTWTASGPDGRSSPGPDSVRTAGPNLLR